MGLGLPYARPGQVIGLLGGSFDPAHAGHVHITREALKRFGLDQVWWLVTPGNPLKSRGPASLEARLEHAGGLMQHPRVKVTDVEAQLGTRYTAETIVALQLRYPGVRLVWLMGADNLAQFHRWERWREIIERVPLGVLARPGDCIPARTSKVAQLYGQYRIRARDAFGLGFYTAPAWSFINIPMQRISSSEIREKGEWD